MATYVDTNYQLADLGTKAITKGETWLRLTNMMGIKAPGRARSGAQADVTKNKAGVETTSRHSVQSIGEKHLSRQAAALAPLFASLSFERSCRQCGVRGVEFDDCIYCSDDTRPMLLAEVPARGDLGPAEAVGIHTNEDTLEKQDELPKKLSRGARRRGQRRQRRDQLPPAAESHELDLR